MASSDVCSGVGTGCDGGGGGNKRPPKRYDHHDVCFGAERAGAERERTSSKKPEYTTTPPPPSGPNPYENAFDASGLSTTNNEYGGPGIVCGVGFAYLSAALSQNHRRYSDPRGRGRSGKSAGGGKGLSSGPFSSHIGSSECSLCNI